MNSKWLITLLVYILTFSCGLTQGRAWVHFSIKEGVPSSNIYSVIQDHKGYIWITTDRGVAKYNGYEFKTFTTRNGLPLNDIWDMGEDKYGRIWLGMKHNEAAWYIENDKICSNQKNKNLDCYGFENQGDRISAYGFRGVDKYGIPQNVYGTLGGTSYYFLNYDKQAVNWFRANIIFGKKTDEKGILSDSLIVPIPTDLYNTFYVLSDDSGANYYISTINTQNKNNCLWHWNTSTQKLSKILDIRAYRMGVFCSDKGSIDSLLIYTSPNQAFSFAPNSAKLNPLSDFYGDKSINRCYKDREGNEWLATSNDGLWMLPVNARHTIIYSEDNGFQENNIWSLARNSDGRLFIGTSVNNILSLKNGKINKSKKPILAEGLSDYEMVVNSAGDLYSSAGYRFKKDSEDGDIWSSFVAKDICLSHRQDNIYSCGKNFYTVFNTIQKKSNSFKLPDSLLCYAISDDYADRIWLGSTNGLFFIADNKFDAFKPDNDVFWKSYITDIASDYSNQLLWAASEIHGLKLITNDSFYSVNELSEKNISRLSLDKQHNLWISTSLGFYKLEVQSIKPFRYQLRYWGLGFGLLSSEVNCVATDDDFIYAGTPLGLSIIPKLVTNNNYSDIPIYIEKLSINGKDTTLLESEYQLNRNQTEIKLQFSGLSYQNLSELYYEYSINNAPYRKVKEHEIILAGLQPGDYEIIIYALDENGNKSKMPARLQFYIKPYFTETRAFVGLMVLLGLITIGLVVLFRIRYLNTQLDFKKRYVLLKLQALQSQMNPHFVFIVVTF